MHKITSEAYPRNYEEYPDQTQSGTLVISCKSVETEELRLAISLPWISSLQWEQQKAVGLCMAAAKAFVDSPAHFL